VSNIQLLGSRSEQGSSSAGSNNYANGEAVTPAAGQSADDLPF
jgi:hypothetical protein